MDKVKAKQASRTRRKIGIRKRVYGTTGKPRLSVYRSSKHMYAQVIDDMTGTTVASASTVASKAEVSANIEAAKLVGTAIAKAAKSAGVSEVAFDRNGFRYHGRVKALADAAREGGLKF